MAEKEKKTKQKPSCVKVRTRASRLGDTFKLCSRKCTCNYARWLQNNNYSRGRDINYMCGFVWVLGGVGGLLVAAGRWGRTLLIPTLLCKWMFSKSASTHALWMRSALPGHLFDTPVST